MDPKSENPKDGIIYDWNDTGRITGYELARPLIAGVTDVTNAKQRVVIADTVRFGLSCWLALAGKPNELSQQFSAADEHWFHQGEVHGTLLRHECPRRILGLGAGDGLISWRTLQHPTVEYFKMADWDHDVARLCLEHVPLIRGIRTHSNGKEYPLFEDPRLDWREEVDVRDYIPKALACGEKYDVIIGDLPVNSLDEILVGALHYIFKLLEPGGVYVYQAGSASVSPPDLDLLGREIEAMRKVFGANSVLLSVVPIESFAYPQAFISGWKGREPDPLWVPTHEAVLRLDRRGDRPYYSPAIHRKIFTLEPEFLHLFQ